MKRTILGMLIGFLAGFGGGLAIKLAYEAMTFKPYTWGDKQPVVVNCYGDDFSEAQFLRAIHYWTIRGHNIAFYEQNPPASVCETEGHIEGFIILRKARPRGLSESTLAVTKRWTSFDQMRGAVIQYRAGTQNLQWINEHELGHALGYAHVEEDGHIMHPQHHKMEGKFWIP
tara:strand:- start:767 stop:1282 length:516 start_codon:yes stop_codon:yes gene_type:complete